MELDLNNFHIFKIPLPKEVEHDDWVYSDELNAWLMKEYHIEVGNNSEGEYGEIFYNNDYRSWMGFLEDDSEQEIIIKIVPQHYVPGFEQYWEKLKKCYIST